MKATEKNLGVSKEVKDYKNSVVSPKNEGDNENTLSQYKKISEDTVKSDMDYVGKRWTTYVMRSCEMQMDFKHIGSEAVDKRGLL